MPRALLLLFALGLATPTWAQDPLRDEPGPPVQDGPGEEYLLADADDGLYHTPLAGKRLETEIFGEKVLVEARDRGNVKAVSLGAVGFTPNIGGETVLPMFAFYLKLTWPNARRLRATLSGLVNTIDFAEEFGGPELLFHWENNTIPFETTEIIDGESIDESAVTWGTFSGWVGAGYKIDFWPHEVDNNVRFGIYYHGGYEYHQRGDDIDPASVTATDTYVHGLRLRLRVDAFQRNIMELPHLGVAFGGDVVFARRDHWRGFGNPNTVFFNGAKTRDYYRASGYVVVATPLPFLSERHRFVGYLHAGYMEAGELDRYNAFRLGGGPAPTESDDLARNPLPGSVFDQFIVEDYLVATLEYRFELFFFLYLHARFTWALIKAPTRQDSPDNRIRLRREQEYSATAAMTSGFLWNSRLLFEYTYDIRGAFRGSEEGHSFMVMISKSF